ncbi:MAG: ketoacyl-ACP synthase III [Bacteroidota bacterium]
MAIFSVHNFCLKALSACVPVREFNNMDYDLIPLKERETLIKMTGVEKRRIAKLGMTTGDLCEQAAVQLFAETGWNPASIDVLVFVSQSRDFLIPCTSVILQHKLGLPKTALAFDIPLGCSGFIYGMAVMGSLLSSGVLKRGILMAGDISTVNCSFKDKSTFPLFGDAGSVAFFEYNADADPVHFNLQSDGSGWEAISIPEGGMRNFANKESFDYHDIDEGVSRNKVQLTLNGIEVFNFSLREVAPNINELLTAFSFPIEKFDYYLFHQANLLMNESIRKKLRLPKEKVPYTLAKYGNTSSASIPLTIISEIRDDFTTKDLSLLLCGFGVGLSWGTAFINTSKVICPEVIDYKE